MKVLKKDCLIDFYTGTGKGGQYRNRHYNCVRIRHIPTGIIVTAADQRSQAMNLATAFERLAARLKALSYKKPKRIPTKLSLTKKNKVLERKKRMSEKKSLRKKIEW